MTFNWTIQTKARNCLTKSCQEFVAHAAHTVPLAGANLTQLGARDAKANAERGWQCSCAQSTLLTTSMQDGRQVLRVLRGYVQPPNPLRTVCFVGGEAGEINRKLAERKADPSQCLGRIRMKERADLTTTLANCHDVLNSPDLIINDSHGYQEHALSQQFIEQIEPNVSLVIYRELDNS